MAQSKYKPSAPGPQNPGKYPVPVGNNYRRWGEQPGWMYNPWTDRYSPDPKAQEEYAKEQGLIKEQKQPSLMDSAAPLAVGAGTPILVKEGLSGLSGLLGGAGGAAASTGAMSGIGPVASGAEYASMLGGTGGAAGTGAGLLGVLGPAAALAAVGYNLYDNYNRTKDMDRGDALKASFKNPLNYIMPTGFLPALFAHKSTKARTKERFGELSKNATDNAYRQLLEKGREESLAGVDTWDLGDDIGSAPIDLMTRSYGVLKAGGADWAKYTDEQRQKAVKAMVEAGLINNKKGDWIVDDIAKAQEIISSTIGVPGSSQEAFDASGNRLRPWQPGDKVYGRY